MSTGEGEANDFAKQVLKKLQIRTALTRAELLLTQMGWGMKEAAENGGWVARDALNPRCQHMTEDLCKAGHEKIHFDKGNRRAEFYFCAEFVCIDLVEVWLDKNGYEKFKPISKHKTKEKLGDLDWGSTLAELAAVVLPNEKFWSIPAL